MRELKYTSDDLKIMQTWPLERKIQVTQAKIMEFYNHLQGQVFVSTSGGKDSAVLLDLARRVYPDIEAVFVDTGLEYPEVRNIVINLSNITILKPKKTFVEVVKEFGWCYPSKDLSHIIYYAKRGSSWANHRINGRDSKGETSKWCEERYVKWKHLVDAPYKISAKCCEIMKENPLDEYSRKTKKRPIVGTMAADSIRRKQAWFQTGCNNFSGRIPMSKPISFWSTQDVLQYLTRTGIKIASVYGDIVEEKGKMVTTGEQRTGCMFCPIGSNKEKVNRFQRMAKTHPKLHRYCMDKLGLGEFLDYVGVSRGERDEEGNQRR